MGFIYKKHDEYPDSIIIRDFVEKVTVTEIISSWEYLTTNNLITDQTLGVINNLTDCELRMDLESFKTLISYLKSRDILKNVKLAVICNNPQIIVFPKLGEFKEKDLKIKAFATIEAAVHWIMQDKINTHESSGAIGITSTDNGEIL